MSDLASRLTVLQGRGRLPSIVGAVFGPDRPVQAAGVRAVPDQQYRVGSISKTFTAVLVLRLREEGLLDLDDELDRHLPGTAFGTTSIRSLLDHGGGLPAEPAGPWWERTTGTDLATLCAQNPGDRAVAGPREFFHYSNLAYGFLGGIVERHRHRAWIDCVRDELIAPLALERTTYHPQAPHAQGASVEHFTSRLVPEPHTDTRAMAPAGQLWSTVDDLARWAQVLAGRVPDVLPTAVAGEMVAPGVDPDYGLGLRRVVLPSGTALVGHSGSMPGFLASLFVEPGTGRGCVALANGTTGLDTLGVPRALLGDLADLADDVPEAATPWTPTSEVPAAAGPLLGVWFWGNTALEFRWQAERLQVRTLQDAHLAYEFEERDGVWRGVTGYLRGETLTVHAHHLECATFVFTRAPYDERAPIPGGMPGAIGPTTSSASW